MVLVGYIGDILYDADRFAQHRKTGSGVESIRKDDVALAVQSYIDFRGSGPPPREVLMKEAAEKNRMPIPAPPDKVRDVLCLWGQRLPGRMYITHTVCDTYELQAGVRLPHYALINQNFTKLPVAKV